VTSPALGGPSLKSLVKKAVTKEVSKQLAGKTGPQGAPGALGQPGTPGQQGPPGPTAAGVQDENDPTATPDLTDASEAIVNAPTSGRLLVIYTTSPFQVDCSAGDPATGLYVDGAPVPDTHRDLVDEVQSPANASGITAAAVSPGNHLIENGVDCPDGNLLSVQRQPGGEALTGILLGG
jgi:hypothetical protein